MKLKHHLAYMNLLLKQFLKLINIYKTLYNNTCVVCGPTLANDMRLYNFVYSDLVSLSDFNLTFPMVLIAISLEATID